MRSESQRIQQELDTVNYMIRLYCKRHHNPQTGLCDKCSVLTHYSQKRLVNCQFGEDKPVCSECVIHCYRPDMRQRIRTVMRYAGPRMIFYSPRHGIRHLYHKWRDRLSKKISQVKL